MVGLTLSTANSRKSLAQQRTRQGGPQAQTMSGGGLTSTRLPSMARRRARWLIPLGAVGLICLMALGVWGRLAAQRAEQRRLREAEVGRAPVSAPKRTPTRPVVTAAVAQPTACITGLVTDHGEPVAGLLVSASDAPPASRDCPCLPRSQTCTCHEALELFTTAPRAALVDARPPARPRRT
jgi:hypothetical protein